MKQAENIDLTSKRVCMLLADNELIDTRVINEAKTLVEAGYVVRLVMPSQTGSSYTEQIHGFEVSYMAWSPPPLPLMFRLTMSNQSWLNKFQILNSEYTKKSAHDSNDSSRPATALAPHRKILRRLATSGLDLLGLQNRARESYWLGCEVVFAQKAIEFQPDIIHSHDLPMLRLGCYLAEIMGKHLVYDAHELHPFRGDISRKVRAWWQKRELADINCPDLIITVNYFLARIFLERYRVKNIQVIYNTTPYEDYFAHREISRARLIENIPASAERHCVLLYLGNLAPGRGIAELIDAIALLPDYYYLAVLGDGPIRDQIKQRVKDKNLEKRVFFHGMIPREHVLSLAVGADIGLVTQHGIGLNEINCSPNRLSDYLMTGLPLALSDLPFLRWFIETFQCGDLFDPHDPRDIAKVIRKLFDDPSRFEYVCLKAIEAAKHFNWDVESQKFLELYVQLS